MKKLSKLMLRYGVIGYGMYFFLIESVAEQITSDEIDFRIKYDSEVLADRFKIADFFYDWLGIKIEKEKIIDIIEKMMKFMIDPSINLFQQGKDGQIYAWKIAKYIENSIVKNPDLKKIQKAIKENEIVGKLIADKSLIKKLEFTSDSMIFDNISEDVLHKNKIPDYPGNEEFLELFPENPGFDEKSINYTGFFENPGKSRKIPENPGQNRTEENRIEQNLTLASEREGNLKSRKIPENTPSPPLLKKKKFHDWIYLTDKEYQHIIDIYGKSATNKFIKKMNHYIGSLTGNIKKFKEWQVKSHFHMLLKWMIEEGMPTIQKKKKKTCPVCNKKHDYALSRENKCKPCLNKEIQKDRKKFGIPKLTDFFKKGKYNASD